MKRLPRPDIVRCLAIAVLALLGGLPGCEEEAPSRPPTPSPPASAPDESPATAPDKPLATAPDEPAPGPSPPATAPEAAGPSTPTPASRPDTPPTDTAGPPAPADPGEIALELSAQRVLRQNVLVVNTEALRRIEAGGELALRLRVFSGQSQAAIAERTSRIVQPDESRVDPDQPLSGRLDARRYRLVLDPTPDATSNPAAKPLTYRVGATLMLRDADQWQPAGGETLSAAVGPDQAVIHLAGSWPKPGHLACDVISFQWRVRGSLAIGNQVFDVPGAHFEVTAGEWTGHFFTARRESDVAFASPGIDPAWNRSSAIMAIPWQPGPTEVTVAARGGGLSARQTVRLMIDPELAEPVRHRREADLAALDQAWQQAAERQAAELQVLQGQLVAAQRQAEHARDASTRGQARAEAERLTRRIDRRRFDNEAERIELERKQAQLRGRWRALLLLRRRQLELSKAVRDMELKQATADPDDIRQARQRFNQAARDNHRDIAEVALLAGDLADLHLAMRDLLATLAEAKRENWLSPSAADLASAEACEHYAEAMARLGDDRARAAELYTRAHKLRLTHARGQTRDRLVSEFATRRPPWWPSGQ